MKINVTNSQNMLNKKRTVPPEDAVRMNVYEFYS